MVAERDFDNVPRCGVFETLLCRHKEGLISGFDKRRIFAYLKISHGCLEYSPILEGRNIPNKNTQATTDVDVKITIIPNISTRTAVGSWSCQILDE